MVQLRKRAKKYYFFGIIIIFLICAAFAIFFIVKYKKLYKKLPTNNDLHAAWEAKDYRTVFDQTAKILERRPNDTAVRMLHGFAAYYLSSAQTSETDAHDFLDESIVSLRKALYTVEQKDAPQLYYILGKAYYQKGYFYYDAALKYLNKVFDSGEKYPDLNKFRGMAFSYLGENQQAIEAFTNDLSDDADEFLLYALAKNYIETGNFEKAKMYLTEAAEKAKDVMLKLDCMAKLAEVFFTEGNIEKARAEYVSILAINEKYADAYYGLGLIYEQTGDLIKARAEWRKALKANPLHAKTIEKLR